MLARWQIAIVAAVSLLGSVPARAQNLTAAQILQQFKAVIFGSFSSSADVEGGAIVGGSVANGATLYRNPGSEAPATFAALSVYGSTCGSSINLDNGAGVTVAGLNRATMSLNRGSSVFIGGGNSGNLTVNGGAATIGINGDNSATVTANGGGTCRSMARGAPSMAMAPAPPPSTRRIRATTMAASTTRWFTMVRSA